MYFYRGSGFRICCYNLHLHTNISIDVATIKIQMLPEMPTVLCLLFTDQSVSHVFPGTKIWDQWVMNWDTLMETWCFSE